MTDNNKEFAKFLIRKIPKDLHQRFKVHCLLKERSMNQEFLRLMKECLSDQQEEKK